MIIDELVPLVLSSADMIRFVYESTPHNSPLRRLFRDDFVHYMDERWLDCPNAVKYHHDFYHDVLGELFALNKADPSKPIREVCESDHAKRTVHCYHQPLDAAPKVLG